MQSQSDRLKNFFEKEKPKSDSDLPVLKAWSIVTQMLPYHQKNCSTALDSGFQTAPFLPCENLLQQCCPLEFQSLLQRSLMGMPSK